MLSSLMLWRFSQAMPILVTLFIHIVLTPSTLAQCKGKKNTAPKGGVLVGKETKRKISVPKSTQNAKSGVEMSHAPSKRKADRKPAKVSKRTSRKTLSSSEAYSNTGDTDSTDDMEWNSSRHSAKTTSGPKRRGSISEKKKCHPMSRDVASVYDTCEDETPSPLLLLCKLQARRK
ncbi:hypothetical protein DdX_06720 [Ditylenchus destructor]|uniref:Uncharacterized protein n=1 Tax=Ditylenchus destructor TaxID=166010 RepID=A0AAD4NAZ1_9BILA|nr:hypothetical protein DdX_06720 [Ditylenchus destructor]